MALCPTITTAMAQIQAHAVQAPAVRKNPTHTRRTAGTGTYISRSVPADPLSLAALAQVSAVHPACRSWRILARAFRDEVPHVWHQHVTAETRNQCVLAILAATPT
jgi:hypothetical protein